MTSDTSYPNNHEEQTESKVLTIPFASAPEIYGDHTFVLDKNVNILTVAEQLAFEAKHLLNILNTTQPSDIREQFQMELREMSIQKEGCSTYKMSLRIDPVLWFQHHTLYGINTKNLEQLYNIGSQYAEQVRSEIEHYPKVENENEIKRLPLIIPRIKWCSNEQRGENCHSQYTDNRYRRCDSAHYPWCTDENCGQTGICTKNPKLTGHTQDFYHFSDFKNNEEVIYQCRREITNLNRKAVPCLFHVNRDFRIYADKVIKPSCYPYFIVVARPDATPVITLTPVKHCLNEEYLQTSDAWQAVLQTLMYMKEQLKLDQLPLNRIYVNFGKWMQQKADNPARRSCHAHINIGLTRETIDKINDRNQSKEKKTLFPSLVGSVLPPNTHRLDDAWRLIAYMNDHMTPVLIEQNKTLMRHISVLEAELEELKKQNEYLTQLVFGQTQTAQEAEDVAQGIDATDLLLEFSFTLSLE